MPRHIPKSLPRGNARAGPSSRPTGADEGMDWSKLDRVQVLGTGRAQDGHTGCVNALSWSEDGGILLSGSDDTRICIWTPDSESSSASSPHPLKLSTTISTGHVANIFSAKFLPNAGTPTVVSVAGDHEIRLLEVDRLSSSGGERSDLWGHGGPGLYGSVKVLKCHRDRTKKIATENSPFLFMTVSEDGTVRQHDLRRPHRCRAECPDPLFRAPQGVDLYSLSVSTVAPHIFAVAGRTDTAFVCDRRMLEKHNPSWGNKVVGSGQVHCVRRLGLSDDQWESVRPTGPERMFAGERHITCVKMSPEHADEAIVAFQRHSTSLFSIYDSPGTSSARRSTSPMLSPNSRTRTTVLPADPTVEFARSSPKRPKLGVKPKRELSSRGEGPSSSRQKTETSSKPAEAGSQDDSIHKGEMRKPITTTWSDSVAERIESSHGPPFSLAERIGVTEDRIRMMEAQMRADGIRVPPRDPEAVIRPSINDPNLIEELQDEDLRNLMDLAEDDEDEGDDDEAIADVWHQNALRHEGWDDDGVSGPMIADDIEDEDEDQHDAGSMPNIWLRNILHNEALAGGAGDSDGLDLDDDGFGDYGDDEDGLGDFDYGDMGVDDFYEDEGFYDEDEDYDEEYDEDDDDSDDEGLKYPDRRSADTELGGVEMITPRQIYKGAKNVETVKDCNFLGLRSDKVCSGSDDGHFFVWDKNTGRLEGIWEGDSSIVNVMEQHPSLPLVAVSGIDDTVKMFAPTMRAMKPSFNRTHLRDSILKANTDPDRLHMSSAMNRLSLLQLFASRGMVPNDPDADDDDAPVGRPPNCETQ